jgi:serine/threonine protein kinase
MKILSKSRVVARAQVEHTQTERAILESVDHPFLVRLRYAFQSPKSLYLVLPFCAGGELFQRLRACRRFPEEAARFYIAEMACAIGHLHAMGIVYRDTKPENVLLDGEGHVRLTDYGLAKVLGGPDDATTTFCGTPEYVAPEMLSGSPHSLAVDWYALGVFTWELLAGVPPFSSRTGNPVEVYDAIRRGLPAFPAYFSPGARAFIWDLTRPTPGERWGCRPGDGDVETVKRHPFFAAIDWVALEARRVPPPWTPVLADAADVSNFDRLFVDEAPPPHALLVGGTSVGGGTASGGAAGSFGSHGVGSVAGDGGGGGGAAFDGFSYYASDGGGWASSASEGGRR